MTIEELQELKKYFEAVVKDNDRRALRSDEEEQVLDLIDAEIARQSVTEEDVRDAIEHIRIIKTNHGLQNDEYQSLDLAITALRQMQKEPQVQTKRLDYHGQDEVDGDWKEPCEYCKEILEVKGFLSVKYERCEIWQKTITADYCPMCGRKLR